MKILAIDPGTEDSAYVIWDGDRLMGGGFVANKYLLDHIPMIIQHYEITDVPIEMIASYGMPVGATTFETCVWIGRFMQVAIDNQISRVEQVYRKDVKMHLCYNNRAKDSNVNQALRDRFGEKSTKKNPNLTYGDMKMNNHTWAAFAMAVYYFDTRNPRSHFNVKLQSLKR